MALLLSPAKLVLQAVHFAVKADVPSLTSLAARHDMVLRKDLLLRILLTYLPETLPSSEYVNFVTNIENSDFPEGPESHAIDCSAVATLTEQAATKKVKRLRLLPLAPPDALPEVSQDATALFLLQRAYKVDEEAGLLTELPDLLLPFLDYSSCIRTLMVSSILPLLRRNYEFYPQEPIPYTLLGFQQLPDRVAVNLLLSQTGAHETNLPLVGRDLKCLVGPWLFNEARWKHKNTRPDSAGDVVADQSICQGWEQVLEWLTAHASKSWKVAVCAIEQWDGPGDVDLGDWGGAMWLSDEEQDHLEQRYARAALASAYLIPEASSEALEGAYRIVAKIAGLLDQEPISPLQSSLAMLPPLAEKVTEVTAVARNTAYMRNDLLNNSNVLTAPNAASTAFLQALVLSAVVLSKAGLSCTVRRAGELALLQDEREQKAEASKLIHALANNGPKTDDKFWIKARNEILWLKDWGAEDAIAAPETHARGIFGQVKKEFLEVEILKALLGNTRTSTRWLLSENKC